MPAVTIDKQKIYEALKAEFQVQGFEDKVAELKELIAGGVNPFSQKTDGTPEGWANLQSANAIIGDLIHFAISVAEKVVGEAGAIAAGSEKLEGVVKFLDEVIVLPVYFEPFDGPVIRFGITQLITFLNTKFGTGWLSHIPIPEGA